MELILVMFGLPALITAVLAYACKQEAEGEDSAEED